jgi:hypothetical protein
MARWSALCASRLATALYAQTQNVPPSPLRAFVPPAKHGKQPSFPAQTAILKGVRVLKRTLQTPMPPAGSKILMRLRPLRKLLLMLLKLLRWPRSCPWSTLASGCAKRARL